MVNIDKFIKDLTRSEVRLVFRVRESFKNKNKNQHKPDGSRKFLQIKI